MSDTAGLGRRYAPDERDRNFALTPPTPRRSFRNWLMPGSVSDQGNTPHCVAHAAVHWLRSHRIVNAPIDQVEHYNACKRIDPWPGEDGTSVRASFSILRNLGFVDTYRWAWDADTVVAHIMEVGPVVLGTNWTMGMFTPDRLGYIHPDGALAGGHAYLAIGASEARQAVRIANSWGSGWGGPGAPSGRAWLRYADLDALVRAQGEACAAIERKVVGG